MKLFQSMHVKFIVLKQIVYAKLPKALKITTKRKITFSKISKTKQKKASIMAN